MESKLNQEIREVLELFGVKVSEVKGEWNIIGHLVNVARHAEREAYKKGFTDGVLNHNQKMQDNHADQ